jgi:hypothetical protein
MEFTDLKPNDVYWPIYGITEVRPPNHAQNLMASCQLITRVEGAANAANNLMQVLLQGEGVTLAKLNDVIGAAMSIAFLLGYQTHERLNATESEVQILERMWEKQ